MTCAELRALEPGDLCVFTRGIARGMVLRVSRVYQNADDRCYLVEMQVRSLRDCPHGRHVAGDWLDFTTLRPDYTAEVSRLERVATAEQVARAQEVYDEAVIGLGPRHATWPGSVADLLADNMPELALAQCQILALAVMAA